MPTVPVSPRVPGPPIRWRRSVAKLNSAQVGHVRDAYAAVQGLADDRGYQHHAGIHGLPLPIYCQHTTSQRFASLFLPWHRAYLYFFERALRDQQSGLAQPWWDWTAPAPDNAGIPEAYAKARVGNKKNALYSAKIGSQAMAEARRAGLDLPATTRRQPGLPGTRLPTRTDVDELLAVPDYFTFSRRLEDLHGAVHVYVGGDTGHMSQVPLAAYDPIFWTHHAMIDRIWRMWQLRHPSPSYTADYLNTALPPFPLTVAQTLDVRALGYDYASGTASSETS
jgi:tyrosinase